MKSLKITLIAIFSLAFFTAVNTSSELEATASEPANHEINKAKVKLTAFTERKKGDAPTNG